MRVLFIGATRFSEQCLRELMEQGADVVAVITVDESRANFHADFADLEAVTAPHGIPIHRVSNINSPENVDLIRSLAPDLIFVLGWSQLISSKILTIPPRGCIGSHPSLLPRNRGRHPLVWALVEGLTDTGLTLFYLDEHCDSGDIVWQRSFPITLEDDAGSLYEKITALGREAIREILPQLGRGTAARIPQDHRLATYWRKRGEKDGEIHWSALTMTTYNLIRALTRPYVGAHTHLGGKKMVIWRSRLPQEQTPPAAIALPPGTVFVVAGNAEFRVRTGDGHLTIVDCKLPEGADIRAGIRLGGPD